MEYRTGVQTDRRDFQYGTDPCFCCTGPDCLRTDPYFLRIDPCFLRTDPCFLRSDPYSLRTDPDFLRTDRGFRHTDPDWFRIGRDFCHTDRDFRTDRDWSRGTDCGCRMGRDCGCTGRDCHMEDLVVHTGFDSDAHIETGCTGSCTVDRDHMEVDCYGRTVRVMGFDGHSFDRTEDFHGRMTDWDDRTDSDGRTVDSGDRMARYDPDRMVEYIEL